jgi:hypothetical protein
MAKGKLSSAARLFHFFAPFDAEVGTGIARSFAVGDALGDVLTDDGRGDAVRQSDGGLCNEE